MLALNWRTPGRALPLAGVTVRKDQQQDRMREIEGDLLTRVARLWPRSCHPILLADRGLYTRDLFDLLDGLHGDGIIRSHGTTPGEIPPGVWVPLRALAAAGVTRFIGSVWPILWRSGVSLPDGDRGRRAIPTPGF